MQAGGYGARRWRKRPIPRVPRQRREALPEEHREECHCQRNDTDAPRLLAHGERLLRKATRAPEPRPRALRASFRHGLDDQMLVVGLVCLRCLRGLTGWLELCHVISDSARRNEMSKRSKRPALWSSS